MKSNTHLHQPRLKDSFKTAITQMNNQSRKFSSKNNLLAFHFAAYTRANSDGGQMRNNAAKEGSPLLFCVLSNTHTYYFRK